MAASPIRYTALVPLTRDGWSDWHVPTDHAAVVSCCYCGLTHEVEGRIVDGEIQVRVRLDEVETERVRAGIRHVRSPTWEVMICAQYRAGASIAALARTHGVSEKAIRTALARYGVTGRSYREAAILQRAREREAKQSVTAAAKREIEDLLGPDVLAERRRIFEYDARRRRELVICRSSAHDPTASLSEEQ